jgi:NADH dehydrogenase
VDAVTGAFSFTGRAIAARLIADGHEVVTLVRDPMADNPFGDRIQVRPLALDDPGHLTDALTGVETLYNTYWIRFERGASTFEATLARSRRLLVAARDAGVRRLVHISVVNASDTAPTAYFRAKAQLEAEIRDSGRSYAIVRPTLTFGPRDILVNNLCWVLRRFPVFPIAGDGSYRLQPVHVDDVAAIAVQAAQVPTDLTVDAAGPDIYDFDEFAALLRSAVGSRTRFLHLPANLVWAGSAMLGLLVRDVMLTPDEVTELTASLLVSSAPPAGRTSLRTFATDHAGGLGRSYHSELDRHYRRARGD